MIQNRFTFVPAVHLLLIRGEEVLLLRRYQTGYEDGNYSLIAGHMDGQEPAKSAMIREAKEEAGITLLPNDLECVHVMHRSTDQERIDFFFTATKWSGEVTNTEPEKCDELRWTSLNHLPENTIPYIQTAIEAYLNGIFYSEFGWV